MLVWLDGRDNIATRPQENYAREIMELFTFGVANVVEDDVKAAARVFTGWNLTRLGPSGAYYYRYEFRAGRHDNTIKDFTFPIYSNGSGAIAANGEQEGIDLISALCAHPATGPRLVRKLWAYFVSEVADAPQPWVDRIAGLYYRPATTCAPWCTPSCRRRSSGTCRWCSRATRGRWSSWCGRSRRPAGPATRSTRR